MALARHSEPFSPDGNLSAEGFENLLGTPSLDMLAILVREAVQNCCDATREDSGQAQVYLRIRTLTPDQKNVLCEEVYNELPEEQTAAENLRNLFVGAEMLKVLEIADYGTTGLGGPSRADAPAGEDENADFVNFFRNVGAARDVEGGGGTYGYGKATLYRASRAHSIIVDTSTTDRGTPVRRLMAAQMGKALAGKVTGRHWWGSLSSDGKTADPLTGETARDLSRKLGMPQRSPQAEGRGTTVMILAPHLPSDSDSVLGLFTEYLLWYFWPRMMKTTPKGKILEAFVASGSIHWERVPAPETFSPLNLLCEAMNSVRGAGASDEQVEVQSKPVTCLSPKAELGTFMYARGKAGMRRWLLPPGNNDDADETPVSIIPERLHHIALMRPAQLVVRYEKGSESSNPDEEWGGVFMCSDDSEIENAFARSEPPAHDDWQPESLPKRSRERRFVNVALRRIREQINMVSEAAATAASTDSPLGKPSTAMGQFLPGSQRGGAGRRRGQPGGGGKRVPFSQPRPRTLQVDEYGNPVAEFEFDINAEFLGGQLFAVPAVVIDGSIRAPDEATGFPEVQEWIAPDESGFSGFRLTPHIEGVWLIRISIPEEVAVSVRLRDHAGGNV